MSRTIAIVGGGFSGVITAVHTVREAVSPLHIEIVEPRPRLGAGLAYSTPHAEHRLNVPSRRMLLFEEDPTHFHDWFVAHGLDRSDPSCDDGSGTLFARRSVFACYMQDLLERTVQAARVPCSVTHRRTCATDIAPEPGGDWRLLLDDGTSTTAGEVVVCIGHTNDAAPAPFHGSALTASGRVLVDPWDAEAIAALGAHARLLILGQGLTMGDVLSTLEAQRHRGPILAISRRGLLARAYADSSKTPVPFYSLADDARASAVVRLMRQACADAVRSGNSWNSVIETTREQGGRLWRRLSIGEQCRLIRHARIFWDVHRYRMAPQVARAIERAERDGRLRLVAGRTISAELAPDGIDVTVRLRPTDGGRLLQERFDAVISCVGPTHDVTRLPNSFVQALLRRGLACPHATRLGFEVGEGNILVGAATGKETLRVVGPLSRGACGDIVGAPEISRQARLVAAQLVHGPSHAHGSSAPEAA